MEGVKVSVLLLKLVSEGQDLCEVVFMVNTSRSAVQLPLNQHLNDAFFWPVAWIKITLDHVTPNVRACFFVLWSLCLLVVF